MKKMIFVTLLLTSLYNSKVSAQSARSHGGNLNLGVGFGYYNYVGRPAPALILNYEIDVAENFTLAPFIGFYSYSNNYYWGNKNYPDRYYTYRETAVPVGLKGAYYFDNALNAGSKWDFYLAASLGFTFQSVTWETGYYGDKHNVQEASPLFLAGHIGTRYHFTPKAGIFLDLSTGLSTFGLSLKL